MGILGTVVCRTAGAAGMGAVLYDACKIAKENSNRYSQKLDADHFERIHASTRTLEKESPVDNAIQEKVKNFRMNTPIVNTFISGFFNSLGENILPVSFASLALAGKGFWAKLGAWGLAGSLIYTIAREGFGFGKHNPMN